MKIYWLDKKYGYEYNNAKIINDLNKKENYYE